MRKLSDIYGYGTPSNRFVRPQSQRTENYNDPIECEEELEQEEDKTEWKDHYEDIDYGYHDQLEM